MWGIVVDRGDEESVPQPFSGHPMDDLPGVEREAAAETVTLDTYAGPIHVEWDGDAAATPLGHLAFFA